MTIDERLEFLLQSTESLHATVQEHSVQISNLAMLMELTDRRIATATNAMIELARYVKDHEKRLTDGGL